MYRGVEHTDEELLDIVSIVDAARQSVGASYVVDSNLGFAVSVSSGKPLLK